MLVHKRHASPKAAERGAEKALLQMIQCVESEGPDLVVDNFKAIHDLLAPAPDIAFIDIGLPGSDDHKVGRRIRAAGGEG